MNGEGRIGNWGTKWLMLAFASLLMTDLSSQSSVTQLWYTYNHQATVSKRWGYWFDINHRTGTFKEFRAIVSAARVGAVYQLQKDQRLAAGYAWFGTYLNDGYIEMLDEHRLWQQYQHFRSKQKWTSFHRFRLEERWREGLPAPGSKHGDPLFSVRGRYMYQAQGGLVKKENAAYSWLNWQAATEIMLHAGEEIDNHYYDQWRLVAGPVLQFNHALQLAVLYQYINQYRPAIGKHQNIHSLRLTLLHQLDFRDTGKQPNNTQKDP